MHSLGPMKVLSEPSLSRNLSQLGAFQLSVGDRVRGQRGSSCVDTVSWPLNEALMHASATQLTRVLNSGFVTLSLTNTPTSVLSGGLEPCLPLSVRRVIQAGSPRYAVFLSTCRCFDAALLPLPVRWTASYSLTQPDTLTAMALVPLPTRVSASD